MDQHGKDRPMADELLFDDGTHPVFDLLPVIFRDCVCDSYTKFCLEYPQQVGDYVYATDGRICVRMPATPALVAVLPDIAPKKFPEAAGQSFATRDRWEADPTPLPSMSHLKRCEDCGGAGVLPRRRCTCKMYDDEDAPCHGKGTIPAGPCWECDGTGIDHPLMHALTVRPDVDLVPRWLHILAKHGATLYLPREANTPASTTPVYFTVAGGVEGVLMPRAIGSEEWKARMATAGAAS